MKKKNKKDTVNINCNSILLLSKTKVYIEKKKLEMWKNCFRNTHWYRFQGRIGCKVVITAHFDNPIIATEFKSITITIRLTIVNYRRLSM